MADCTAEENAYVEAEEAKLDACDAADAAFAAWMDCLANCPETTVADMAEAFRRVRKRIDR